MPDSPDGGHWPAPTLMRRLSPGLRGELLRLGHPRTYSAGEYLLRHGDGDNHALLLLRGVVKVVASSENGADALLAVRVGGDLVGELAAIDGGVRSASVIACGDVRTRWLSRDEFNSFFGKTSESVREVTRMIGERLRWSDRRRVDFVARPAASRLARVLLEIGDSYGRVVGDRCTIGVSLTQVELGSLAGLAKRTVEKHLADLQSEKLIEVGYRFITLVDLPALRDVAGIPF